MDENMLKVLVGLFVCFFPLTKRLKAFVSVNWLPPVGKKKQNKQRTKQNSIQLIFHAFKAHILRLEGISKHPQKKSDTLEREE